MAAGGERSSVRPWRRRLIAAALLAAAVLVVVWKASPTRVAEPSAGETTRERSMERPGLLPSPGHERARGPRTRTVVPRFVFDDRRAPSIDRADEGRSAGHPRRLAQPGDGLEDKRRGPRLGSDEMKEALESRLADAHKAAERCMDQWTEAEDALVSGVMLGFTVDAAGLDDVWLDGKSTIPPGPLACIAGSVYPIDWSGITSESITVTVKLRYEADDSGV
jgi:hypothetical protein